MSKNQITFMCLMLSAGFILLLLLNGEHALIRSRDLYDEGIISELRLWLYRIGFFGICIVSIGFIGLAFWPRKD